MPDHRARKSVTVHEAARAVSVPEPGTLTFRRPQTDSVCSPGPSVRTRQWDISGGVLGTQQVY